MKTWLTIFVFSFLANNLIAQLENSIWLHSFNNQEYFIEFLNDSIKLGLSEDKEAAVFFSYKISEDTLEIYSSEGTLCNIKHSAKYLFGYSWKKDFMFLKKLEDKCFERSAFISAGNWELKLDDDSEAMNFVVISIFMDKIVVNSNGNPNALYITDLNGAPVISALGSNQINIAELSSGDYILQVWDDQEMRWKKEFYRE